MYFTGLTKVQSVKVSYRNFGVSVSPCFRVSGPIYMYMGCIT